MAVVRIRKRLSLMIAIDRQHDGCAKSCEANDLEQGSSAHTSPVVKAKKWRDINVAASHHSALRYVARAEQYGAHEIDETQELNYASIAQAIVATGFDGYLAQEFIP